MLTYIYALGLKNKPLFAHNYRLDRKVLGKCNTLSRHCDFPGPRGSPDLRLGTSCTVPPSSERQGALRLQLGRPQAAKPCFLKRILQDYEEHTQ